MFGDTFETTMTQYRQKVSYCVDIPDYCNPANMNVLVFVQREYDDTVKKIDGQDLEPWFVDNCNSGPVGTVVLPRFE